MWPAKTYPMKHRLPSLSNLGSGLADLAADIITPTQLRELGWAAAGGAAGFIATGFALPVVSRVPGIGAIPKEILQGLLGIVGGRLTYGWNQDFAKGLTGGVTGHAVARGLTKLVGFDFAGNLADPDALPGQPGAEELSDAMDPELPEMAAETDVVTDESELSMGEVDPTQQFRGGFGATVEDQAPLGAWLS